MTRWLLLVGALWLAAPAAMVAQDEDQQGCKDSKLLSRLPGCIIRYCSAAEFDAADLTVSLTNAPRTRHVEGRLESISYSCKAKTALQVRRNAEQALRSAGYTIDFSGYDVPIHYVTGHNAAQWVAVEASELTGDSDYKMIGVLERGMTQEMTADASEWAAEINKSGRVAVYGVEFDTGKATLKPESEKVLAEVRALLTKQPDWKLQIEGHTDATGTKGGNQTLSQQRAASVVAWLVKNGVAAQRLTSAGLGDTKPVADNGTPEGRARNRRVELVKQ